MRGLWLSLSALAVTAAFTAPAARAEPYQWCAVYTGKEDGARNCGFVSREQCMETVRGMGGFCDRNLFYTGPENRPVRRSRKHDD